MTTRASRQSASSQVDSTPIRTAGKGAALAISASSTNNGVDRDVNAPNAPVIIDRKAILEQAIFQILSAYGVIKETQLEEHLKPFLREIGLQQELDLRSVFQRMNKKLSALALEVRSLVRQSSEDSGDGIESRPVYYHSLVNTEEDYVAKTFGSIFQPVELNFFTDILTRLLTQTLTSSKLSTDDVTEMKPEKWSANEVHRVLSSYIAHGWLERDDHNFLTIGVRSYLELKSYLETVLINSSLLEEESDEEKRKATLLREKMPQILIY